MKPWNGAGDETLEPQVPEGAIKNTVTHTHTGLYLITGSWGGPRGGIGLLYFPILI